MVKSLSGLRSLLIRGSILLILFTFFHSGEAEARQRRARRNPQRTSHGDCAETPQKKASLTSHTSNNGIDLRVVQSLVDHAEQIATNSATRRYNGGHVVITSGFRGCERNSNTAGSAKNSTHLRGHAIDIRARDTDPRAYASAIESAGLHRGGYYNTCVKHVHLDTEHSGFTNECGGKGNFKRRAGSSSRRRRR